MCNRSQNVQFTVQADVAGGAARVRVCLDNEVLVDLKCAIYSRP